MLLWLLFLTPIATGFSAPSLPVSQPESEGGCNLPAPNNLHIVSVGSNTATIAWDAVPGAWGYKVTLSQGGNPPSASGNTTATSMTFTDLGPGTYTAKVYSKCTVYDDSQQSSQLQFSTIVIELICSVSGNSGTSIINGSGNEYEWPWSTNQHYFIYVTHNEAIAKYEFNRVVDPVVNFSFNPGDSNPPGFNIGRVFGQSLLYCGDQSASGYTGEIKIKDGANVVASCSFPRNNVLRVVPVAGYSITVKYSNGEPAHLAPGSPPASFDGAADGLATALPTPLPNPFSDMLYLSGGASDAPVQGALYDACGRCVRQFDYDRSGLMAIPTDDLLPGMYFLQLRSASGNSTHKLLKL